MELEAFSHFIRNRESLGLAELLGLWIETHPHRRLPPVREITLALRISSRDVVAQLEVLRAQGRIETRTGSGSWPAGAMPARGNPPRTPRQEASGLADDIREGIASGKYPTGERLPTAKELARTWKCHPRTASRALDMLVAEARLVRDSRGWTVPRPRTPPPKRRPKVLLVGAADGTGILRMDSDREIDFWREVSTEIARNGLESARHLWTGGPLAIPPGTLGLIVSTWHHTESEPLLEAARSTRLPVCTWMEGLDPATLKSLAKHERLHLHDVAHSEQAGHDMGRHLLDQSATRLAWISPFHSAAWSRSREAGLFRSLGGQRATARSFHREGLSEWDFLEPAWSDPTLLRTLPLRSLQSLTGGRGRAIVAQAAEQLGTRWLREALEPLLEQALEWGADAWVGCNDRVAVLVQEWLAARGEGNRLVAGFDDSALSLRHDLTSYRFDTTSMARSMILQILSYRPRAKAPGLLRHGGHVVPRGSSTRAAGWGPQAAQESRRQRTE